MRKIYRDLTKEQKEKGVIFSSCLSENTNEGGCLVHEVIQVNKAEFKDKPAFELIKEIDKQKERIRRFKDDSFFNESSFKYNIIRT